MVDQQRQSGSMKPSTSSEPLESVVVERDIGPTRCTIYPPAIRECERTTTWLSADLSAFVSLDDTR